MVQATLDGDSLGNVQSIRDLRSSNIAQLPLPGSGATSSELIDLLGATRLITVTGQFVGVDAAAVKTAVELISAQMEVSTGGLIGQAQTVNLIADQVGTVKVKIAAYDATYPVDGASFRADYVLTLLVGVTG